MRTYITLSEGGDRASVDDCCYRGETATDSVYLSFLQPFTVKSVSVNETTLSFKYMHIR